MELGAHLKVASDIVKIRNLGKKQYRADIKSRNSAIPREIFTIEGLAVRTCTAYPKVNFGRPAGRAACQLALTLPCLIKSRKDSSLRLLRTDFGTGPQPDHQAFISQSRAPSCQQQVKTARQIVAAISMASSL